MHGSGKVIAMAANYKLTLVTSASSCQHICMAGTSNYEGPDTPSILEIHTRWLCFRLRST